MVLKDETIDSKIRNAKGLDYIDKQTLLNVSNKGWFRSYARQSRDALDKILKKVKKGIKKGGYTYFGKPVEEPRGYAKDDEFKKPKPKKDKTKPAKKKQGKKKQGKAVSEKTKTRVEKALQKYPDATNYEAQHGVNSKASQNYRIRHNRPKNYEGRVRG